MSGRCAGSAALNVAPIRRYAACLTLPQGLSGMEIRLLGAIEASVNDRAVALGPPQQRAVLAMLALQVNRTVSTDRLIEGLWDERAPASAHKLVQLYVSH